MKPTTDDVEDQVAKQNDESYGGEDDSTEVRDIEGEVGDTLGDDAVEHIKEAETEEGADAYEFSEELDEDEKRQAFTTEKQAKELREEEKNQRKGE